MPFASHPAGLSIHARACGGCSLDAKLLRLIGHIYDAALDDSQWERALATLASTFASEQALMLTIEHSSAKRERLKTVGLDLGIISEWQQCKEHVDVWLAEVFEVTQGEAYFGTDIVPRKKLRQSGFYADILRPLDIEYCLGGLAENNAHAQTVVPIYNSNRAGQFSSQQKHAYRALLPHIRRALNIGRCLATARNVAETGHAVIDQSPYAIVVLAANRRVLRLNSKAERLLRDGDGMELRDGRLQLVDGRAASDFDRLVHEADATARGQGSSAGGTIYAKRVSARAPYAIQIAPLNARSTVVTLDLRATCLVFIHDPAESLNRVVHSFAVEYELSRAETALLGLLLAGRSIKDAASARHVSPNTARTQLKSLFTKIGCNNQRDLLRLASERSTSGLLDPVPPEGS